MNDSQSSFVDVEKFVEELPKAKFMEVYEYSQWEGYWLPPTIAKAAITFRTSFEARDDDVFIASSMKTGTTWLKALLFCIMQTQNPQALTIANPHILVPTVEAAAYLDKPAPFDIYDASAARLLHTHLPHVLLPDSVKNSACKIVCVARNPRDTLISNWHFHNRGLLKADQHPFQLEKYVDHFCSGFHTYGPFVEHVAGYWEESKKRPQKILFLKYEDLKDDPKTQVLKIAQFLGTPFGDEQGGEVDEIVRSCSLENLKNLEVNKSGSHSLVTPNSFYFRKGEVGDWKNYLTPEMEMKLAQTISLKLEAIGLYL